MLPVVALNFFFSFDGLLPFAPVVLDFEGGEAFLSFCLVAVDVEGPLVAEVFFVLPSPVLLFFPETVPLYLDFVPVLPCFEFEDFPDFFVLA